MNSLLQNAAIALVALAGLLATASCSSQESFTKADLLAELRERGLEFVLADTYSEPVGGFGTMHGLVATSVFERGDESLWAHQFEGPGEALIAAYRVRPGGDGMDYPGGGTISHPVHPPYYYQRNNLIVTYSGRSKEIPDALDDIMGESFAGQRAYSDRMEQGEDFPLFKDLWREHPVTVDSVQVEKLHSRPDDLAYRFDFEALTLRPSNCYGGSESEREVIGDEIHFTFVQRVVNPDEVELTEPCDLGWRWEEAFRVAQWLTAGQEYKVFINDEQVATFTAEG